MAKNTPRRKNNGGCWLTGIITLFVVMILVLVGLFLPPFDIYNRLFSEPFAILRLTGDSILSEDGTLRITAAADYPDANTDQGQSHPDTQPAGAIHDARVLGDRRPQEDERPHEHHVQTDGDDAGKRSRGRDYRWHRAGTGISGLR